GRKQAVDLAARLAAASELDRRRLRLEVHRLAAGVRAGGGDRYLAARGRLQLERHVATQVHPIGEVAEHVLPAGAIGGQWRRPDAVGAREGNNEDLLRPEPKQPAVTRGHREDMQSRLLPL